MKNNWVLVAIIGAVLAVPFGLALRDDTTQDADEPSAGSEDTARAGVEVGTWRVPGVVDAGGPAEHSGWTIAKTPDRSFYDSVLLAGTSASQPALDGPLAGLQFGMTRDEARLAAPAAAEWQRLGTLSDHPGASLWLDFKGPANTLSAALVSFSDPGTVLSILIAAWGEPDHAVLLADGPIAVWFDEAARTRTVVTHWSATERSGVAFAHYVPTREVIAPKHSLFGFETRPILGATKETVLKAYADRIVADTRTGFRLPLLVTEYASEAQQVDITLTDDRVARVEFPIEYRLEPNAHVEILALLEAKLGRPSETEPGGRTTVFTRTGERITVERRADATLLFVTIERR